MFPSFKVIVDLDLARGNISLGLLKEKYSSISENSWTFYCKGYFQSWSRVIGHPAHDNLGTRKSLHLLIQVGLTVMRN